MVSYLLILKIHSNDPNFHREIPFLKKIVKDVNVYCTEFYHFDPNFIPVGFLFVKEFLLNNQETEEKASYIMKALIIRTIKDIN